MACDLPAPPAKATCSWRRKADPQGKMGGQPTGSQGTPKSVAGIQPHANEGKKKEPKEDSKEDEEDSSWYGEGSNKSLDKDSNSKDEDEGHERSADDPKSFPPKVDMIQNALLAATGSTTQAVAGGGCSPGMARPQVEGPYQREFCYPLGAFVPSHVCSCTYECCCQDVYFPGLG